MNETTYEIPAQAQRVCDIPERMRPRELIERIGVENVADDVLLAILLRSGVQGVNVVDLSRYLISKYGSFTGMAQASASELASIRGMGKVKAQVLKCALDIGRRMIEEAVP
ncbi:MAG: hypothetical protein EOM20_19305, partial [Spartobacteria bacterium]|nr:hypothetical protein [Spartobacteria bacterium]